MQDSIKKPYKSWLFWLWLSASLLPPVVLFLALIWSDIKYGQLISFLLFIFGLVLSSILLAAYWIWPGRSWAAKAVVWIFCGLVAQLAIFEVVSYIYSSRQFFHHTFADDIFPLLFVLSSYRVLFLSFPRKWESKQFPMDSRLRGNDTNLTSFIASSMRGLQITRYELIYNSAVAFIQPCRIIKLRTRSQVESD